MSELVFSLQKRNGSYTLNDKTMKTIAPVSDIPCRFHENLESIEESAPSSGAKEPPIGPAIASEMTFQEKLLSSLRHLHV
jgi:hypothetical protein